MACPVCRMDAGAGPPKRCLVGERKTLAYGHAANAKYAEGPHLYKIEDHYLLLMAEGGSDYNHAVTALTAKSLWGPYVPCTVNPVLTHRHLGRTTLCSLSDMPIWYRHRPEIGMLCFSVNELWKEDWCL